ILARLCRNTVGKPPKRREWGRNVTRASTKRVMTLAGIVASCLLGPSCTGTPTEPPPVPPPPGPSEVLVGAGDIGVCGSSGTEATAKLLDGIGGGGVSAGGNGDPQRSP